MLKEKGHLISLKKSGMGLPGTSERGNVISKVQITKKLGTAWVGPLFKPEKQKYVTYTYTHLKPKDVSGGNKEFTYTPFEREPPDKPHSFKGSFKEVTRIPVDSENRMSIVYDGGQLREGRGVTLFVHKIRTGPNSSRAVLEEFDRQDNEIVGKHTIEFNSGKAARDFMRYRYGIDVTWGKKQ